MARATPYRVRTQGVVLSTGAAVGKTPIPPPGLADRTASAPTAAIPTGTPAAKARPHERSAAPPSSGNEEK